MKRVRHKSEILRRNFNWSNKYAIKINLQYIIQTSYWDKRGQLESSS